MLIAAGVVVVMIGRAAAFAASVAAIADCLICNKKEFELICNISTDSLLFYVCLLDTFGAFKYGQAPGNLIIIYSYI